MWWELHQDVYLRTSSCLYTVPLELEWFATAWTTWSYWYDIDNMTEKHILEVKCWYQCRSCRQSSLAVVCPHGYKVFACNGRGLRTLHAKYCPRTYPFRFRHVGRDSLHEMWHRRCGTDLMTAMTQELSEQHYKFLVSKETVVLRRWRDQNKNLVLSNELIKVKLPP